MNRERFIRDRRSDWSRFEQLLGTLQGQPERQWRAVQVALLAECATREDVAGLLSTADLRLV